MSEKNDNIIQHEWGYELIWANKKDYLGKIMVFSATGKKTPFVFNAETDKTYFVNYGSFKLRWIATDTGNIFESELNEGQVWDCNRLVPCSLEAKTDNASISVVSTGQKLDTHTVLRAESF